MDRRSRQTEFLERMQQRISRYQPLLEQEFRVELGQVSVQPLCVRLYVASIFERIGGMLEQQGRSPKGSVARMMFQIEKRMLWYPACAWVWFRFWYPQLAMQWSDERRVILVSFLGWSADDYSENAARIDQYVVHELAHGIWDRVTAEAEPDRGGDWRQWNEGFAHYLADVHFRSRYPPEAVVREDWPGLRGEGKRNVAELVRQQGNEVLRRIPTDWQRLNHTARGLQSAE